MITFINLQRSKAGKKIRKTHIHKLRGKKNPLLIFKPRHKLFKKSKQIQGNSIFDDICRIDAYIVTHITEPQKKIQENITQRNNLYMHIETNDILYTTNIDQVLY